MNIHYQVKRFSSIALIFILAACSSTATKPEGADEVRHKLAQLQADSKLASRAPLELDDAEIAVRAAEQLQSDEDLANHLVLMADRKVDIAATRAKSRLLVEQRKMLSEQSKTIRLDARAQEVGRARADADSARQNANIAQNEAIIARAETQRVQMDNDAIQKKAKELQQQITELNVKPTDRGLVMTLGDLLFATGKADINGGAISNLDKLVLFLNKYPNRTVIIEGHTDNVGSDNVNLSLSRSRANSVKNYLVHEGIDPRRLTTLGKGEDSPIADNNSVLGRQQNRRVEVIISGALALLQNIH